MKDRQGGDAEPAGCFNLAPDAALPVIAFQCAAQALRCNRLKIGIDGRPHAETAGKELTLAKILAQLAPDLIREIVARRQFGAKTLEVAVLNHLGHEKPDPDLVVLGELQIQTLIANKHHHQ